jgi:transposase InsO family protein
MDGLPALSCSRRAPCPGWAHHIAGSLPGTAGQRGAADLIPDNGIVERMNRTIKDATVKRYFYETHDELRVHLRDFVDAYNFARRLKTLKGLSPLRKMPGLNS